MHIRTAGVQFMRDNPERFIESNTETSWLRYLNNMCIQGMQIYYCLPSSGKKYFLYNSVTGHIDECYYVSTTALQSSASISMCNELTNAVTQSSINKHFLMSIYNTG